MALLLNLHLKAQNLLKELHRTRHIAHRHYWGTVLQFKYATYFCSAISTKLLIQSVAAACMSSFFRTTSSVAEGSMHSKGFGKTSATPTNVYAMASKSISASRPSVSLSRPKHYGSNHRYHSYARFSGYVGGQTTATSGAH